MEENFWISKYKPAGYTYVDLGKLIDKGHSVTRDYFTGKVMPSDSVIATLCEFFDVDFETGKAEFQKSFDAWTLANSDRYRVSGNSHSLIGYKYVSKKKKATQKAKIPQVQVSESATNVPRGRGNPGKADNFWRQLRVQYNVSFDTLMDITSCSKDQLKNYFCGENMPSTTTIKILCNYFRIPYQQGKKEFKKMHTAWLKQKANRTTIVATTPKAEEVAKVAEAPKVTPVATTTTVREPVVIAKSYNIMEALYGKVSYEEFNQIIKHEVSEDLLRTLYGKLDFDLFMAII